MLVSLTGADNPSPQSSAWDGIWYRKDACACFYRDVTNIDRKVRYVSVYSTGVNGVSIREMKIFGIRKYFEPIFERLHQCTRRVMNISC